MRAEIQSVQGAADPILQRFLRWNLENATQFVAESDIVQIEPLPAPPGFAPDRFIAEFRCKGFVRDGSGVRVADRFSVGVWFAPDYLVAPPNVARMLTLLTPRIWHPNVAEMVPVVCIANITPGMPLVDLCFALYELFSWQRMSTHDPLNPAAAQWARDPANRALYPVDNRPLKRRAIVAKAGAA
jgi:hypothetical protein